jgi:signal transduction histidine kinase
MDLTAAAKRIVNELTLGGQTGQQEIRLRAPARVVGRWDPVRIDQLVTNLITNALKYGLGKPIEVVVSQGADNQALLQVSDQGIGIPRDMHAKIFERFERVPSSESRASGLGLGLYVVKQIVDSHRGTITVESELGRGSTFVVRLPLE